MQNFGPLRRLAGWQEISEDQELGTVDRDVKSKDTGEQVYDLVPGFTQMSEFDDATDGTGPRVYSSGWERYVSSYRAGLLRSALMAGIVLALNIALDAWMFSKFGADNGSAVLLHASCRTVHAADTAVHFVLNVLSTLILGASNYCMQALCAPTRAEIEEAHAKRKWADIGTQSLRNLRLIGKERLAIWIVLGISSLPLHLFFNSVFFSSGHANQYAIAVVSTEFFNTSIWTPTLENTNPRLFSTNSSFGAFNLTAYDREDKGNDIVTLLQDGRLNGNNATSTSFFTKSNWTNLDPEKCIQEYAVSFPQDIGDIIVVSSDRNDTDPLFWTRFPQRYIVGKVNQDPFLWICEDIPKSASFDPEIDRCTQDIVLKHTQNGKNWTVAGHPVSSCLSRTTPDICNLQYNVWMMLAVVVFGLLKTVGMIIMVFRYSRTPSLLTIGDAIASFLEREDRTTLGMCLVSSRDLHKYGWSENSSPRIYHGRRQRWWSSTGRVQFYSTHSLALFFFLIVSASLGAGIAGAHGTAFTTGLGTNIQSLTKATKDTTHSSTLVPTLLIASLPQLGFSFVYLVYNNLFTQYHLAQELSQFAAKKKGLRVSDRPRGAQRSTRWLSLPARYALPLMTFSAVIHWLLSQSLFLVRIDGVDTNGIVDVEDTVSRLGYSSAAIVAVMVVTAFGIILAISFGAFRWLDMAVIGGGNSVCISAACHPALGEGKGIRFERVGWGDVGGDGEIGHCALTAGEIRRPVEGRLYAGDVENFRRKIDSELFQKRGGLPTDE